jgi:hypothetical protein
MYRTSAGLFLISSATLLVEVLLTRIFDVLLWPNVSFTIISCALFGLGLGGMLDILRPPPSPEQAAASPGRAAFWFALSVWMLPLALNLIPFSFERVGQEPARQGLWFLIVYLLLLLPFVLSGFAICRIFATTPRQIHKLYSWDLVGAAVGSAVLLLLLRPLGPEYLLIGASLIALAASALLSRPLRVGRSAAAAIVFVLTPVLLGPTYLRLSLHENKRNVESAINEGELEFWAWDPVSQIAVVNQRPNRAFPWDHGKKHVAYDGGTQSSNFYPFDGDLEALQRNRTVSSGRKACSSPTICGAAPPTVPSSSEAPAARRRRRRSCTARTASTRSRWSALSCSWPEAATHRISGTCSIALKCIRSSAKAGHSC